MNNYDYPIGSDTADAPWNEEETEFVVEATISATVKFSHKPTLDDEELHSIAEERFREEFSERDLDILTINSIFRV